MIATHRARAAGFTLIEVIVAVALFAMLMGLVYSGFSTAVRAYDAAEHRVVELERMRVVSAFIRRSLGGAQALAIAARREWAMQFEGDSERVRYIADLPGYVGSGGVHELVLELDEARAGGAPGQRDLVLRRRPLTIDRDGELSGDFESRVLAENVDGFALRFFGRAEERDEPQWRDEWPAGKTLPLLVELSITPAGETAWPLLTVQTHVNSVRYLNTGAVGYDEPSDTTITGAAGNAPTTSTDSADDRNRGDSGNPVMQ